MEKTSVKLDKPRYIGSAILALSKTVMYNFHYTYMMKTFPDCKLLFSDTDSFCYSIPGVKNVYEAIKDCELFDFSNFPKDHPNFNADNKMVPGKFKDESPANPILEFVGLRSKMYSILPKEGEKKAVAKGVNQRITKREIKHKDYRNCLMNNDQMYHKMVNITHDKHTLETSTKLKKSLSPFNDKKWINKDGEEFTTYSFGHKDIPGEPKYNYKKYIKYVNFRCGGDAWDMTMRGLLKTYSFGHMQVNLNIIIKTFREVGTSRDQGNLLLFLSFQQSVSVSQSITESVLVSKCQSQSVSLNQSV